MVIDGLAGDGTRMERICGRAVGRWMDGWIKMPISAIQLAKVARAGAELLGGGDSSLLSWNWKGGELT